MSALYDPVLSPTMLEMHQAQRRTAAFLSRLDAERTDRLYREALIREYGEVPSPVLLALAGKQLILPDRTKQLTMWGRVIATVPPLIPNRQYGEPCFIS